MDIKGMKSPVKFKYTSPNSQKMLYEEFNDSSASCRKLENQEKNNVKGKSPRISETSMDAENKDQTATDAIEAECDIPDIDLDDPINFEPRTNPESPFSVVDEDELRCASRAAQELVYSRIPTSTSDSDSGILTSSSAVDGPTSHPDTTSSTQDGSEKPDNMKNKEISNGWNGGVAMEYLEDDAHLKVTYSPGKKGGNFGLPLGAKISIPDGLFAKKDTITCQVAPPAQRWRHCPVLPSYEHLTSEIFILNSTAHALKKNIIVQLPFFQIDMEYNELNVKGKWKDENEWVNVGFLKKEDTTTPLVELEIDRLGIFVVTFTPKKELFDVTPQGCLYNAHISRYISIRFPKKAADKSFQCAIQITPITPDKLEIAREFFPNEVCDLVIASEIIDITPSIPCNFRRAVSVKLPLPTGVEIEDDNNNSLAVFQKLEKGWELVDTKYKFTRTTVTFDVKSLSRFCVAQAKPDRKKRIISSVPVLEGRVDKEKGEIIAFLNLQEKFWFLVLESFPESKAEARIAEMKGKGFKHVQKQILRKEEEKDNKYFRRPPPKKIQPNLPNGFELFDGMKWTMEVVDDIKVGFESDYMENKELQYFRYLPESCRKFVIEPKNNEEKAITGAINLTPQGIEDTRMRDSSTFTLKIDIDEETVKAYFRPEVIPEEPEPVKEKPNLDLLMNSGKQEEKTAIPFIPKFKPLPPTVMERLMKTSRKPIIVEKETKTISGKSLRTLSKMVPEGLTLAVHLDLPDSTITGLGFDAISNGLSMADVTYKILLYWKRQQKDKKDGAIDLLSTALRDMGRGDIGSVVVDCHRDNKELTMDAFLSMFGEKV